MTTTVQARTARKAHQCAVGRHAAIAPGHRYLRHIAFPSADGNESGRVQVIAECVACACERDDHAGLLDADACSTFCHGDVPCALPHKHDGDHSCRRCPAAS